MRRLVAVLVFTLGLAARAHGAAGDLDVGFGDGGIARLNVSDDTRTGVASAVLVQPDGRIVAAGWGHNEGALVRYLPDGTLDASFGRGGRVLLPYYLEIRGLARQSDGALIALCRGAGGLQLVRLGADGTLDPSFGDGSGLASTPLSDIAETPHALALLPDDRIAVAGAWSPAPSAPLQFAAMRFTADGMPDTGFGIGGLATVAPTAGASRATALAVRLDGTLTLAGTADSAAGGAVAIVRLTPAGTPDATFGTGGAVTVELSASTDWAIGVAPVEDGGLVVAAATVIDGRYGIGLVRVHGDGSLDPAFGDGGLVRAAVDALPATLVRTADGRLAVGGSGSDGTAFVFQLTRFTADGALDPLFDGDGIAQTGFGTADANPWAAALAPDGSLVLAGQARQRAFLGWNEYAFALARYAPDGTLDASFDGDGRVTTPVGGSSDRILAMALQPDGRIVVAGSRGDPVGLTDFALGRLHADGTVDTSFGSGGATASSFHEYWDEIRGVVIQPDGRIVGAGVAGRGDDNAFVLVRHHADGSIDPTFGDAGVVRTVVGGVDAGAYALARQADGRLVAAGYASDGTTTRIALARYTADGTLDATFGSAGTVTTAVGTGAAAFALAVQPDGRLVVAGHRPHGATGAILARYLPDGRLDLSFGTNGIVDRLPGGHEASALARLDDGRLLVAGRTFWITGWDVWLARLHTDGTLDTGFGDGGTLRLDHDSITERADAVAVLPSGRIAVGGERSRASGTEQLLHLVAADGSAVASQTLAFGVPHGLPFAETTALLVQPDGRLLAAGAGNGDFAVVRYRGEHRGCPARPASCAGAARSVLLLRDDATEARDRLVWKWLRGAPLSAAALGDPRRDATYALCLYAGATPALIGTAVVPPDPLRWTALGARGYAYRDASATHDGIAQVLLKGSDAPRSRILVKGRGAALADPPRPLAAPITVQLVDLASDHCWGATFTAADVSRNDARLLRARH